MSSEWPQVLIGDLADPRPGSLAVGPFGSRMKADLYVPAGVRVIRGNNLGEGLQLKGDFVHVTNGTADSLASCCLTPGDLVFPHRGNIGEVGITPDDGHRYMLSTSLMKLSPNRSKVDPLYLFYFFKSVTGRAALLMNASQVGTPGIATPLKSLRGIALALPPLEIQRAITAFLQALDDRITLLRETNATLEAIAQALFKSWFVDFDPVRAKMEGRTPEGMDEATAALFPDGSETSELGEVPRGWRVGRLDDLLVLQRGFDLPAQDRTPGSYPIIAASGPAGTHTEAMVSGPGVVTGRSGVLGRVFLCLDNFWPLNTTLWVKEFKAASACYAYEVLRLLDFKSFNAGSAVPTLNRNHIHGLPYLIPTRECIQAYESVAMPVHQRVKQNELQAHTLSTLRDTLLPRLISGQLRLPEAQAALEATP